MADKGSKSQSIDRVLKGAHPEIARLMRAVHSQGFRVTLTGRKHFKVLSPPDIEPKAMMFAPKTPSAYSSIANTKSALRRIGVRIP